MITIREKAKDKKAEDSEKTTAENKSEAACDSSKLQQHGVRATAIQGMLNDGLDTGAPICEHADAQPVVTSIPMLDGLNSKERTSLLTACVGLIGVPVDRDALNAVLRLCLRLTQDFEQVSSSPCTPGVCDVSTVCITFFLPQLSFKMWFWRSI